MSNRQRLILAKYKATIAAYIYRERGGTFGKDVSRLIY